ncbi:5966_t:CDS:1, partial [Dentiscutata erythropus]
ENSIQKSVNKKLWFTKSISFAKQAITLQDNDKNDNELDTFLKSYIGKKMLQCEKETKKRELQVLRKSHSLENALAIETENE